MFNLFFMIFYLQKKKGITKCESVKFTDKENRTVEKLIFQSYFAELPNGETYQLKIRGTDILKISVIFIIFFIYFFIIFFNYFNFY